jgi:hypothetical protein
MAVQHFGDQRDQTLGMTASDLLIARGGDAPVGQQQRGGAGGG